MEPIFFEDDSERWLRDVMENHLEEARARVSTLLETATRTGTTCLTRDTAGPAKVRFLGRQLAAYRFVLCVVEEVAVGHDTVVRHRCHNRQCFNPEHLQFGTQADNKRDDWEFAANGVDFDLL